MINTAKLMPQDIWRAYERGQDYKRSIGLFDTVRRNKNFFCGKQWEGLRVKSLDPLIFNVLRRCVNLFISLLVSDDVAVEVKPFTGDETTEKVLSAAMQEAIERSKVKTLGRGLLKNACVDGDGAYSFLTMDFGRFSFCCVPGAAPIRIRRRLHRANTFRVFLGNDKPGEPFGLLAFTVRYVMGQSV